MIASEARIRANQQNSLRSTGPRTPEGKERSRRNGLKHGLSGQGVIMAEDESREIAVRTAELQAEMAPRTALGSILVGQIARFSVQMERAAAHELAAIGSKVRHAADDFDEAQLDEADRLLATIGDEPRKNLRKLRRSPEGVDRLLDAWHELRSDLTRDPSPLWTPEHRDRAENLTGRRVGDFGQSPIKWLSEAIWGDFRDLGDEAGHLDATARRAWAVDRLVERIDDQIAELAEHRETLDLDTLEIDRLEAGQRALFDPSKEATLARRYESAATRGFYKALNEFRKVETQAIELPQPSPPVELVAALASSGQEPAAARPAAQPGSAIPPRPHPSNDFATARTLDGHVLTVGRPNFTPA